MTQAKALLSFIGKLEAPRGYNTIYGNHQDELPRPITEMTLNEVLAAQKEWRAKWKNSAAGRYQFIPKTLAGLKTELGLTGDETFNPALQDRLAMVLLKRRGFDRYMAGKISHLAFGNSLAMEWASLPLLTAAKRGKAQLARGQSYYAGVAGNKSLTDADEFERVLLGLRSKQAVEKSIQNPVVVEVAPPPKSIWKSKGMWGSFTAILGSIGVLTGAYASGEWDLEAIVPALVTLAGAIMAGYGRYVAKRPVE